MQLKLDSLARQAMVHTLPNDVELASARRRSTHTKHKVSWLEGELLTTCLLFFCQYPFLSILRLLFFFLWTVFPLFLFVSFTLFTIILLQARLLSEAHSVWLEGGLLTTCLLFFCQYPFLLMLRLLLFLWTVLPLFLCLSFTLSILLQARFLSVMCTVIMFSVFAP